MLIRRQPIQAMIQSFPPYQNVPLKRNETQVKRPVLSAVVTMKSQRNSFKSIQNQKRKPGPITLSARSFSVKTGFMASFAYVVPESKADDNSKLPQQ